MEKIIEEMAKDLENHICMSSFQAEIAARMMYAKCYRKQVEAEWIKKHRHRGGFETYTGVDEWGETHTITIDTRYECDDLYCSICGKLASDVSLNYCSYCGAKMKGN